MLWRADLLLPGDFGIAFVRLDVTFFLTQRYELTGFHINIRAALLPCNCVGSSLAHVSYVSVGAW